MKMTFKTAAAAVGGYTNYDGEFTTVFSDSRDIKAGGIFIALKGPNFDGHDFVSSLKGTGAVGAIVKNTFKTDFPAIYVEDTHEAMRKLAAYYRNQFDIPVIGVTGSVGKTTTKEMIYYAISTKYNTLKNVGNLNNTIGLPSTLFNLNENYEAAVLEMATSIHGEMKILTEILRPTIGVITAIGTAHIETLGSREGILKEKLEITKGMKPGSPLVINIDNDILQNVDLPDYKVVTFGIANKTADVHAVSMEAAADSTTFVVNAFGKTAEVFVPAAGYHNVYNALTAIAVSHLLGVDLADSIKGIANYVPAGMRQKVVKKDGITRIIDCYNSSPEACSAALTVLRGMQGERKIAVLGDMLELGSFSAQSHADVGYYAASNEVDLLFTYGEEALGFAQAAKRGGVPDVRSFKDSDSLSKAIKKEIREGDVLLFKASRGMKMETVIEKVFGEV